MSPTLRRVWLTGRELATFTKDGRDLPAFRSEGPDDHVKFFFPSPIDGRLSLPVQAEGTIDWPRSPRPVARDYTPRGFTDGDTEVAFDFVLHGHGVASTWAETVEPGDRIHLAGPKSSLLPPDAKRFVLLGDQTALPAICNWLERLPSNVRADVVILIEDEASRIDIETRRQAKVDWIVDRSPDAAQFIGAIKTLEGPDADTFVWGAMEAGIVLQLREWFLKGCGLAKAQLDMTAYWRRGTDDDQLLAASFNLRETVDLTRPYAIRAAVQFRLPDLVASGAGDVETLASRAGLNVDALSRMLPIYLDSKVFEQRSGRLTLGLAGELLRSDMRRDLLSADTARGRMGLAAAGTAHFLATGESAYGGHFGREIDEDAATDPQFGAGLGHEAGHMIENLFAPCADQVARACAPSVTVTGLGADAVLAALLKSRSDLGGMALLPAHALAHAREHLEEARLAERARLSAPDEDDGPTEGTLVISAIGRQWSDAAIVRETANLASSDVWVIELDGAPDSTELHADAVHLGLAFGVRQGSNGTRDTFLKPLDFRQDQTHQTGSGLRLTRFCRTN